MTGGDAATLRDAAGGRTSVLSSDRGALLAVLSAVLALTAYRLILGILDRTELSTDEAQYWVWGQALEFGAYSKPPLIGWIIRASTDLFGDSVAAVRVPAALFHAATALVIHAVALRLVSSRTAAVAALTYLTMPAVTLGSALMTTDTPMLLAAALALWAQLRLAEARAEGVAAPWVALGLGLALGIGVLAKHAMLFWLIGAVGAAVVSSRFRLRWRDAAMAALAMGVVVLPHLLWLARHEFVTLHHVEAITAGQGLSLLRPLGFLADQLVVLGPLVCLALVLALVGKWADRPVRGLAVLVLVPVGIVLVQAVRGPVLANWAVLCLVPGAILAATWLARHPWLLRLSLALGLAVALVLPAMKVFGTGLSGPDGKPILARYLGHAPLADWALSTAAAEGAGTLVATERDVLADLAWFGRDAGLALRAVPPTGRPTNHWEATAAYRPEADSRPVFLLWRAERTPGCEKAVALGSFTAPPGAYGGRRFVLYRLADPSCLLPGRVTP